jgi:RNA polymerase sigma factor (sigma-70 family)
VGDRRAFHQLVLRHEARLRAFLGRVAGAAEGDDLAQDSFLRAWQRSGEYRGEGSYFGWLAGIGWRLFLDRRRRDGRRAQMLAAEQDGIAPSTPAESGAALDIERLFAQLGDAERAAMTLCLGHGHSHGEAAAILDLPLGTVKSLVLRGRDKLQRWVAERDCP